MNKTIFNIVNKTITDKLPEVKYFGLYRNQFMNVLKEREIDYPAILLEIKPITFNQQLMYNQDSEVTITLHVGMQIVNNVERGDKTLDNSLQMLELMDRVHEVFDGIRSDNTDLSGVTESHIRVGIFTRSIQEQLTNVKSIWVGKVSYTFPLVVAHNSGLFTTFIPNEIITSVDNTIL